jgi:hypothetical protein
MIIKIYGERNCGTNYLEKLIETNLEVEILKFRLNWWSVLLLKSIKFDLVVDLLLRIQRKKILGWKHGCAPINEIKSYDSESLVIVTITKNPYSFLYSLYRNPYHIKGPKPENFSSFIRQKWVTRRRDLCHKKYLGSPIELWNIKNKSYVQLKSIVNAVVINLTYEELIKDPEGCIQNIAFHGNIKFAITPNGGFKNYLASTKNADLVYENYRGYYLNEEWKIEFSDADLRYLNTMIDNELLQHFNYQNLNRMERSQGKPSDWE